MLISRLQSLADRKTYHLLIVILIIGFIFRVVAVFRSVGGDEAIILYYGWMIAKGKILYLDLFNQKSPGVFFTVALVFLLVGKNILFIRVLSAFLSIFTAFILFEIGKKINNPLIGIISAILYELEPIVLYFSTMVYSETFMVFFMVLAVYFYIPAHENNSTWHYLVVGILLGFSTIMKQPGIITILVIVLHLILSRRYPLKIRLQSLGILAIGLIISIIPLVVYLLGVNALNEAIYSTFFFNLYIYGFPLSKRLNYFYYNVLLKNMILWIVGVGGALFTLERRKKWDIFLVGWCIASFSFVSALITPYDHYYIQGMPAFCLLGGIFVGKLFEISEQMMDRNFQSASSSNIINWLIVTLALFGMVTYSVRPYLDIRYNYGLPYQIEAAEYIKAHTSPDEIIFSPDPAYYLLTDRENKYYRLENREAFGAGTIEAFGISDLPQYLESERIRYVIIDHRSATWIFNDGIYRSFFNDDVRAEEVKIVYEWILENYFLEATFGSGSEEINIYHSRFW